MEMLQKTLQKNDIVCLLNPCFGKVKVVTNFL